MADGPLLGVAGPWGDEEVRLARQFDELHQLIYVHGGVSPTNAAVEEVAKLVFLRLWSLREPSAPVTGTLTAGDLFGPGYHGVAAFKRAFPVALRSRSLRACTAAGATEPIWSLDEPFRLANDTVLAAAVDIVRSAVGSGVSDPLGTAFDALLSGRYDHAGGLGTYLTPSSVARMMAEVGADLRGGAGTAVGDPFCGTGRFLVALLEVLPEPLPGLFGADQSPSAVAKARINLLLYGLEQPRVWTVADSITDVAVDRLRGTAGLVLTNPPFGEGKYASAVGIERTGTAVTSLARARAIDPAMAGLVRCLDLLAPAGVLGIVLPDGVVESRAFDELVHSRRGRLAGQADVVANISLPVATFSLSGTAAKTSAVFLRRGAPVPNVALARVDHVGYLRQAGRAVPDPRGSELAAVSMEVRDGLRAAATPAVRLHSTSPLVALVPAGDRCYELSRVDPEALLARRTLIDGGGVALRELISWQPPRRSRAIERPFVSVLNVDELGNVDWAEAADYTPTTPGLVVHCGELIVSLLNPAKLRAAVIPDDLARAQVSAEFGVFAVPRWPYAVLALLYAEPVRAQLRPLGRGTSSSRRRITAEDVLSLAVPRLSDGRMAELDAAMRGAYASVATGRGQLRSAVAAVVAVR